ncbi:TetR/AcrR family transcriptional regulator [Microbacterium protaetiae]|uniref:TetR/AcrR family transcriptional regulator n=1 Tax=Microbacterium protaetiae TaxID=2509458 RepID=UPI0013EDBC51|nr:TetR/AcrR family transcriptional regulator [Microbacterium protaetiae]
MTERKVAALKQERSIATREALIAGAARVFARLSYGESRLRGIAVESGASEGSMYFHFGTKAEMARAVLEAQQERMKAVLQAVQSSPGTTRERLFALLDRLAMLISTDEIVQGGIRLAGQASPEVAEIANAPYIEWVHIVRDIISQGIEEGSIRPDIDLDQAAEFVNSAFVGAQVLAGLDDSWASFPQRVARLIPWFDELLAPHR